MSLGTPFHKFRMKINQEIHLLYEEMCKIVDGKSNEFTDKLDIYFKRKDIYIWLRELLNKKFFGKSRLANFPMLDTNTFNSCIYVLHDKYSEENIRVNVLLHIWSYLTGIKVVRLKNNSMYYYNNKHLLPNCGDNNTPELYFDVDEICTIIGSSCKDLPKNIHIHQHHKVPRKLLLSSMFYRTLFNRTKLSTKEVSIFILKFFKNEIQPLIDYNVQIKAFLNCVLRLKDTNPCYSLGIIKLLQNTCIYFSNEEGSSRSIISPCTISSIGYLGFQDGIFIEKTSPESATQNVIDYLFGLQFYNRALFERYELEDEHNKLKFQTAFYHPTYLTSIKVDAELNSLLDTVKILPKKQFGCAFRSYIQNTSEPSNEIHKFIECVIDRIDTFQLKTPLRRHKPSKTIWFDSSYDVDVSGKMLDTEEPRLTVNKLIKHLYLYETQKIINMNLSNNNINTDEAIKIAKALSYNIIPDLEELNMSSNQIYINALEKFKSLLLRGNFKRLILYNNNINIGEVVNIYAPPLLNKVIWIPRKHLETYKLSGKISDEVERHHKNFYESGDYC